MPGRLANCPCAVVTSCTLARIGKCVRVASPQPTRRRVAGIAGLGGLRMDRRFASCSLAYECAVVAGGAGTLGSPLRRKVAKCAGGKSGSRMAITTLGHTVRNMLQRRLLRYLRCLVTDIAIPGGPAETTLDMTSLADLAGMRRVQDIARRVVIKRTTDRHLSMGASEHEPIEERNDAASCPHPRPTQQTLHPTP